MVDFDFYTNRFLGSAIAEEAFPALAAKAGAALARLRRCCRVTGSGEAEAMAICAMAEVLARADRAELRSASVGSLRISCAGSGESTDQALYRCAATYLDICRGVG